MTRPLRHDPRYDRLPQPEPESIDDVLRAVGRLLRRQADGEPADPVESASLLRRMRRVRG